MRRVATVIFVVASVVVSVAGCWNLAAGPGNTGTGGSATEECSAPAGTTCQSCSSCALNGPCASAYQACQADGDCTSIDQCVGTNCGTGDPTCVQTCESNNPCGASAFEAVWSCLQCQQCKLCGLCTM